jgi:threonine dehydrogenase-like Zn-dependent dehydrogenase
VKSIGATDVSALETPLGAIAVRVGQIDVVYEASGASQLSFEVIKQLGVNGIFVFTGVPGRKRPVDVDTDLIMRNMVLKNQAVFGSVNASKADFQNAIRDLGTFHEKWPESVRALITGRHPAESYNDLLVGPPRGIKNVLQFAV